MNTWETFFREKSARRANKRDYHGLALRMVAAVGFLILITAIIVGLNSL